MARAALRHRRTFLVPALAGLAVALCATACLGPVEGELRRATPTPEGGAAVQEGQVVPRFGVAELVLRSSRTYTGEAVRFNPFEANPFADVQLQAEVTAPSGKNYSVQGFFDGDGEGGQNGNVFKARVFVDEPGDWTWRTMSTDASLTGHTGGIRVAGTLQGRFGSGPVVVSEEWPRYLRHAEGEHLFLLGKFLEENLAEGTLRYSHVLFSDRWEDTDRDALVQRHLAMGLNKINLYLANKGDYQKQSVTPWLGTPEQNDRRYFDLARWHLFDRWVQQLLDRGLAAEVWFFADDSGFGSLSAVERRHLIAYGMARLSASPHTLFIHSLEWQEGFKAADVEADMRFLRERNPWQRLVSVHSTPGDFPFPQAEWLDFLTTQAGFEQGHRAVNTFSMRQREFSPKPHLLEEFTLGEETVAARQESWAGFLGGAAGIGTGAFLQHLSSFAARVPYYRMDPANDLLRSRNGYVLAEQGREYVVYLPEGGQAALDLSQTAETLTVAWYNPRTGAVSPAVPATIAGGDVRVLSAPDSADWVLHLRASTRAPDAN